MKILNKQGLARITFLAYPPTVKGGVQVAAGRAPTGEGVIAAAPIACDRTREIRLFNHHGGLIGSFIPDLVPPYVIAAGNFLSAPGTEFVPFKAHTDLETLFSLSIGGRWPPAHPSRSAPSTV